MMDVLALGSQTHPVKFETYLARNRVTGSYPASSPDKILASWEGSLFNYFFANCWMDLRGRGPDRRPSDPRDLWQNDKFRGHCQPPVLHQIHASGRALGGSNAFLRHLRRKCLGPDGLRQSRFTRLPRGQLNTGHSRVADGGIHPQRPQTDSRPGRWRFTARPVRSIFSRGKSSPRSGMILRYQTCGVRSPSASETPTALTRIHVEHVYDKQQNLAWVRYADFLNGPWINNVTLGVNEGPMLLAIENYRSGMIWKLTAKSPEFGAGLDRIFSPGRGVRLKRFESVGAGRRQTSDRSERRAGVVPSPDFFQKIVIVAGIGFHLKPETWMCRSLVAR